MVDKSLHVLLIDDDVDMHDVVRLMLEPQGHRVRCCNSGPAGLQAMRAERPDVVLLDIMLGTPTEGLELVEQVKADEDLGGVTIILISSAPLRAEAERTAADGFLEKPLDAATLRGVIAQCGGGESGDVLDAE